MCKKRKNRLNKNKQVLIIGLLSLFLVIAFFILCVMTFFSDIYMFDLQNPIPTIIFFIVFAIIILSIFYKVIRDCIFLIILYKNKNYLINNGKRIETSLKEYEEVAIYRNGFTFKYKTYSHFFIISSYKDKNNNIEYNFKSGFYNEDIKKKLKKGDTIFVYVDEQNINKYYVDIEESIRYKK